MTITITDLHPADLHARMQIRFQLRQLREDAGLSQSQFAELSGTAQTAVSAVEIAPACGWRISTVQRYARHLGRRLTFRLDGIPEPPPGPLALLHHGHRSPVLTESWERAVLCERLAGARVAARLRQLDVAARLGVTVQAVSSFERTPDGVLMVSAQRYARAIGGALIPELSALAPTIEETSVCSPSEDPP